MLDAIVRGISRRLFDEFGEGYAIYQNDVPQGLQEPCFFILCIRRSCELWRGRRSRLRHTFDVQYFPASRLEAKKECYAAAERLEECLEVLPVGGSWLRGTRRSFEVVDGVLHFFVNYDFFVDRPAETVLMAELDEKIEVL